jgi:agmatinase
LSLAGFFGIRRLGPSSFLEVRRRKGAFFAACVRGASAPRRASRKGSRRRAAGLGHHMKIGQEESVSMGKMECPGRRNFLGLGEEYSRPETSLFNIIPVPYDATSTYTPGSRLGPRAIIEASRQIEVYDHELDLEPASVGVATLDDVPVTVVDPSLMVDEVERAVAAVASRNKLPVVLGGEHTVSVGAVRALAREERIGVVSFDAHADLRDSYQGTRYSHACFLRRAAEVADCCVFGVRSVAREEVEFSKSAGIGVFYADSMRRALGRLDLDFIPKTAYLSVDVDVLDPSLMPATGTPEPGGLGWYELIDLLTRVVTGRKVVGFDVVELCPLAGNPAPDFTAAKLVHKLMGAIVKFSSLGKDAGTRHG